MMTNDNEEISLFKLKISAKLKRNLKKTISITYRYAVRLQSAIPHIFNIFLLKKEEVVL